jgi:hypothetical protein
VGIASAEPITAASDIIITARIVIFFNILGNSLGDWQLLQEIAYPSVCRANEDGSKVFGK